VVILKKLHEQCEHCLVMEKLMPSIWALQEAYKTRLHVPKMLKP
jgi:hypothetical protein